MERRTRATTAKKKKGDDKCDKKRKRKWALGSDAEEARRKSILGMCFEF